MENGVWYALDLFINQDTSFYLDTRNLRKWAMEHLAGKRVLNTFAYTGSLGVAARAGSAQRVVYTDLNRKFLNLAKTSYTLNGFPIDKKDFLIGDFWVMTNRMKRSGELFDCVFLDPPFFADTGKGTVDLIQHSNRVINKVRPLVAHGGYLVVVNNALYVSGADFIHTLQDLCSSGYLSLDSLIPVPQDVTGYPQTRVAPPPVNPAPFNHPTKIVVLRVLRKDERII
jgi:23S rRNA (cytosine1962-C5)-methyltransferase